MSPFVAGTTPYPWPWNGELAGRGTALLVVSPAAHAEIPADVELTIRAVAHAVRRAGGVVVTATTPAPHGRGGAVTDRDDARHLLTEAEADRSVVAGGHDAFYGSDLDLVLRTSGVERLLLAGVGLETCVHSTMRDANDRGYECLLLADACVPVDASVAPAALSMIEMSGGIFGAVGRSAPLIAALVP